MISDIMWGYDKRDGSTTYDTVISVADIYIAMQTDLDGVAHICVPKPSYEYTLNEAGTAYNITAAPDTGYSFDRFLQGIETVANFYSLEDGTPRFGSQLSMMDIILSPAKDLGWTIGEVSESVAHKKYSFSVDKQDIYSFLLNDVARVMKVIVDFDRVAKRVNVIDLAADDMRFETGIVTGFHNLLQSVDISTSTADGIKTTFTPKGADDLGVEFANFGQSKITNLDYFVNKVDKYGDYQYGTEELHDKYSAWKYYRDEELTSLSIPSYTFNLNTKTASPTVVSSNDKTRREQYIELTKMYNQTVKDINEITYLVPSDGAMTDYTTFNLKELQTVAQAYINAYNLLVEVYKTETGEQEIVEDEIKQTYFYQDWKLYHNTIIPNIVNALKIYALTDENGNFLDEDGNIVTSFDKLVYPDGGNPQYNGNAELVTKSKVEDYLYDMSLYGLSELNVKKKAWVDTAAQLFKEAFVKTNPDTGKPYTPGTPECQYRTWDEVVADKLVDGFTGQDTYERQLHQYLNYMSAGTDWMYNAADWENGLTKDKSKGVVCIAIDAIAECESVIQIMQTAQDQISEMRAELANSVTYEQFGEFTADELSILHSLSYEADYSNTNILTTNLEDVVSVVDTQKELYEDASKKLFEKSRPQYAFSTSLDNILAIKEFAPLRQQLALLNYVYLRYGLYDDETIKLRIVNMSFNPIVHSEDFTLEFSNMIYTYDGISDFYYLFEDNEGAASTGGSSSSSGSSSGGTYGTNDAEITLSNNMLNALLKNEMTVNSLNLNNILSPKQIEALIIDGDLTVDGAAITNLLKSINFNADNEHILEATEGSAIRMSDGVFNFGGGALTFKRETSGQYKLHVSGTLDGADGVFTGKITASRIESMDGSVIIDLGANSFQLGTNGITYANNTLSIPKSVVIDSINTPSGDEKISGDTISGGELRSRNYSTFGGAGNMLALNNSNKFSLGGGVLTFDGTNLNYSPDTISLQHTYGEGDVGTSSYVGDVITVDRKMNQVKITAEGITFKVGSATYLLSKSVLDTMQQQINSKVAQSEYDTKVAEFDARITALENE